MMLKEDAPSGQVVLLRAAFATRSFVSPETKTRDGLKSTSTYLRTKQSCGAIRSARGLRHSNQYDASALSNRFKVAQCAFGRYMLDPSWCISDTDKADSLTPLDRVAGLYTPTARALTMKQACAVLAAPQRNKTLFDEFHQPFGYTTAPAAWATLEFAGSPELMRSVEDQYVTTSIDSRAGYHKQAHIKQFTPTRLTSGLTELDNKIACNIMTRLNPDAINAGEKCVDMLMSTVRMSFRKAATRSSAEYAEKLYVHPASRVLGNSHPINRRHLRFAYAQLEGGLSVIETVQTDLQSLWLIGTELLKQISGACCAKPEGSPMSLWSHKKALAPISTRGIEHTSTENMQPYCDILLTDVGSSKFYELLPMGLEIFSSHVTTCARHVLDLLQNTWLLKASQLLRPSKDQLSLTRHWALTEMSVAAFEAMSPRTRASRATITEDTAAVLISRQLRVMCERSLQEFCFFFTSFDIKVSSEVAAFQLNLSLIPMPSHKAVAITPRDIVRLNPSLCELKKQVDASIDYLVSSMSELELAVFGSAKTLELKECCVTPDDLLATETRRRIHREIDHRFKAPLDVVALFRKFRPLVDGTVDAEVRSAMAEHNQGDTISSLDQQARLCSRLADLGISARFVIPNIAHHSLFSVSCGECKQKLSLITDSLRHLIAESVSAENSVHMRSICQEYSEVAERLHEEPINCFELRALQEYAARCVDTLTRLMDEYASRVLERIHFLLTQTQRDCARMSMPRDDAFLLATTCQWPIFVKKSMEHSHEVQQTRKRHLEMLVEGQQETLSRDATNLEKKIEKIAEAGSLAPVEVQVIYKRIAGAKEQLAGMRAEADDIERQEKLLQMALTDNQTRLNIVDKTLSPLTRLWSVINEWVEKIDHWQHDPLDNIDAQDAEDSTLGLRTSLAAAVHDLEDLGDSRSTPTRTGKLLQQEVKIFDEEQLPLLRLVCQPGMKERHWTQIKKSTRLESLEVTKTSNLLQMLDVGLQHYAGVIEETCIAAGHEHALEQNLERMEHTWTNINFLLETWRDSHRLGSTNEIQQELDSQILLTQTIQGNKYIRPHVKRAATWEAKLSKLQEIIDNLLRLEAAWLYLEPIFQAVDDDAKGKMATESNNFNEIDLVWQEALCVILRQSEVLKITEVPGLLARLAGANAKIAAIRKGVVGYLDSKRNLFPRFCFISDTELLEILADTTDPERVQPYLKKIFHGIAGLKFLRGTDSELEIVGAFDANPNLLVKNHGDGVSATSTCEYLGFAYSALKLQPIRPTTNRGVECWLADVDAVACKSLALYIEGSVKVHISAGCRLNAQLLSRAVVWQEQVLTLVSQVWWTHSVESALRRAAVSKAENEEISLLGAQRMPESGQLIEFPEDPLVSLCSLLAIEKHHLEVTILAVKNITWKKVLNVSSRTRSSLSAMITLYIHQRDVMCALVKGHVYDVTDFEWIAQLRYYLKEYSAFHRSSETNGVEACCVYNSLPYAYEYLGGGGINRLIYTPLTMRCFRAMFCALRSHAGCALQNSIGVGSTSTVVGLARALGTFTATLNCTCLLGCVMMGILLRGAANCGAWISLESFDRLPLDVLSFVTAQVQETFVSAQTAALNIEHRSNASGRARTFVIESCQGTCVESANYKREIFRPVTLFEPEPASVAGVILCSNGIDHVESCKIANRITTALELMNHMLCDREGRYVFGLRLVRRIARYVAFEMIRCNASILSSGSREKISDQDKEIVACDTIVMQALVDITKPGLAARDFELFRSILALLFTEISIAERDTSQEFAVAVGTTCCNLNYQPLESFCCKVTYLHDAIISWPGVAVIGRPFSGKTSVWRTLEATLSLLHPKSPFGVSSIALHIGALTLGELYGTFDSARREWVDGIVANCYRKILHSEAHDLQVSRLFLVFDGIVDPSWTEHLHTALDESSILCLGNGESIRHSEWLTVIIESENLKQATPTIIGRIGLLHFGKSHMNWHVLFETWIAKQDVQNSENPQNHNIATTGETSTGMHQIKIKQALILNEEECRLLEALADWLLEPCLVFVHDALSTLVVPLTDESLVQSLLRLLDGMLHVCLRGTSPSSGSFDVKERRQRRQHIECAFIWSLIWTVGASGPDESQERFGIFIREIIADAGKIRTQYPKVREVLTLRGWCVPEFTGVFSGTLQLALPVKGSVHDYEYRPRDNEAGAWKLWQEVLQAGQYPAPETGDAILSELLLPTTNTVKYGALLDLLVQPGGHHQPVLFFGPPGSSKTVHVQAALARLPPKKTRRAYVRLHITTSARSFCHALRSHLVRRRKGVYGPPTNQHAIIFVDDISLPDTRGLGGSQMPLALLRGLLENGSWYKFPECHTVHPSAAQYARRRFRDNKTANAHASHVASSNDAPLLECIEDTSIWAATNGRIALRNTSLRLVGRFTLIHTSDPSESTLAHIFSTLVESHFTSQSFASEIVATANALITATLCTLGEVAVELRPTPSRLLCSFDPRDATRCIQGVLRCRADDDFDRSGLVRLWTHEVLRTFGDRLCTTEDTGWFATHLQNVVVRHFKLDIDALLMEVFKPTTCPGQIQAHSLQLQDMHHLVFGDFHNSLERGAYLEARDIKSLYDSLERVQDSLLVSDHSEGNVNDESSLSNGIMPVARPKRLVLFPLVITHISRLVRVLSMPKGGHAILRGITGAGRRSVARLAAHASHCDLREPSPYSEFDSFVSWRRELKTTLKHAGVVCEKKVCMLLAESHLLALETILADICDVISIGSTPGLFTADERLDIAEQSRERVRRQRGNKNAEIMSHEELFSFFLERVRTRFHVILLLSSENDSKTGDRGGIFCRFPSLVSQFMCISNHAPWGGSSLITMAESLLPGNLFDLKMTSEYSAIVDEGFELKCPKKHHPINDVRVVVVELCQKIHSSLCNCRNTRLCASSSTFIEFLQCFKANLQLAQTKIAATQARFGRALVVARHAQQAIATIDDAIVAARGALDATTLEAVAHETNLSHKKSVSGVESKYAEVEADSEALFHEEAAARVLAEEFDQEIAQAQPAFDEAYCTLERLTIEELHELRNLPRPPIAAKPIIEAVCVILGEKAVKVADPSDPTRRTLDYWATAQQRVLIGEPEQLLARLRAVNHDRLPLKAMAKLKDTYVGPGATHEASFADPEILEGFIGASVSRALCRWVCAMSFYEQVSRTAQPKRDAAANAKNEVEKSAEILERKRNQLQDAEKQIALIASQRDTTRERCDQLQELIHENSRRLERARCLLDALTSGGELETWQQMALQADMKAESLVSDTLLCACALTYLPSLDSAIRHACLSEWAKLCEEHGLTVSDAWCGGHSCPLHHSVLASVLDETYVSEWRDTLSPIPWCSADILPGEVESVIESALFAKHVRHWPLLLDPHGIAYKWLRTAEKKLLALHGSTELVKLRSAIETAAPRGASVLIEDISEEDLLDTEYMFGLIPRRFESPSRLNKEKHWNWILPPHVLLGQLEATKLVECHGDFRFYMSTRQHASLFPNVVWDGYAQVTTIKLEYSCAALKSQMLRNIVSHYRPAEYGDGINLVKQEAMATHRIREIETEILDLMATTHKNTTSILDDGAAIGRTQALIEEVHDLREQKSGIDNTKKEFCHSYDQFEPVSHAAQVFFSTISDLALVEAAYAFSLQWFIDSLLMPSFERAGDVELKRFGECSIKHLLDVVYDRVSRSLLCKDKLLFALLLAVRPQLSQGAIAATEWRFLLTGEVHMPNKLDKSTELNFSSYIATSSNSLSIQEHKNPAKAWLPDTQWSEMCSLATLPTFTGLIEEFEAQIKMWKRVHDASEPYTQPLPRHWDTDLQGVSRICILRCLRPDQIASAIRRFIETQLGNDFMRTSKPDVGSIVTRSSPLIPIVVITISKYKSAAVAFVVDAASRLKRNLVKITSFPGPSTAGYALAQERGSWVLMQNPQSYPEYIMHLERSRLGSFGNTFDANFRSWCVMNINHTLPRSVLEFSLKFAYEPPRGMHAVVKNLFDLALHKNPDFFSRCTRGNEFRRLFFALSIYHAVLLERTTYCSLGWIHQCEFENTDLILASDQLICLLDNHHEHKTAAPFAALRICISEDVYTGRVLDTVDRRLMVQILSRFCSDDVLRPGHALSSSGEFRMPLQDGSQSSWLRTVDALPITAPLEFLGLHESVNIEKNKHETSELLAALSLTEGPVHARQTNKQALLTPGLNKARKLLSLISPALIETREWSAPSEGGKTYFMDAVLTDEVSKYNALVVVVGETLKGIIALLEGCVLFSGSCHMALYTMACDCIPSSWHQYSYFSRSGLNNYLHNLVLRCNFFSTWLQAPLTVYWLGAFFSPCAFLSAIKLKHAQQYSVSVSATSILTEFVTAAPNCTEGGNQGAYIKCIFIQGARWDARRHGLVECLPRSRFAPAPLVWLKPSESDSCAKLTSLFSCPLYRTVTTHCLPNRANHQSPNLVMFVNATSPMPAGHWIERGVAMVLQLDDDEAGQISRT